MKIIAVPYAHYLLVAIIVKMYILYIYHIHTMVVVEYNSIYHISMWCWVGTCWGGNTASFQGNESAENCGGGLGFDRLAAWKGTTAEMMSEIWPWKPKQSDIIWSLEVAKYMNVASCIDFFKWYMHILFIANSEDEKNLEVLTPDTWLCCKFHTPVSQPSNQGQTVKIYCIFFVSPFAYWSERCLKGREGNRWKGLGGIANPQAIRRSEMDIGKWSASSWSRVSSPFSLEHVTC